MAKQSITKRQEQAIETRERIYSAAIDLMDQKGFENITIAEISKKAGVSVGAFYHYFNSKNDILAEIFHKVDDYFSAQVIPELIQASILEKIIKYFDYYAKFNVRSGVELTQQLFKPQIKFFIEKDRPMVTILEELVLKGQQEKVIRADECPEEISRFLLVMARGIVFEWSVYNGSYDLEETMHKYIERLVLAIRT